MRKRNSFLRKVVDSRCLLAMLLPGFVLLIVYKYLPMAGLTLAFKNFSFAKGFWKSDWVGLSNFVFLFTKHPDFFRIVWNTLIINILKLLFCFPMPIVLALCIDGLKNGRTKKLIQSAVYLPYFVSWVVFGSILIQLLMPDTGIVNQIISLFGGKQIFFITEEKWFRPIVVISELWKSSGWNSILYLAALASIDTAFYEEARLEGATRFQEMRYVTLPGISDTIVVLLLLQIGKLMDVGFEQIYVLANPAVYSVGDVLSTYIYRIGIGQAKFSITTAIGLFQSVIGLILIVLANGLCRKFFDKTLW